MKKIDDVNLNGWYNLNTCFHIISTYKEGDRRLAECIDIKGNTFYLEITPDLLDSLSSTNYYEKEETLPLEGIVSYMESSNIIYKVFYKENNNVKSITGRTLFTDKQFGRTVLQSFPHAKDEDEGIRIIDNRNIVALIYCDTKFISDEDKQTDL
jgi:hypothetical protein